MERRQNKAGTMLRTRILIGVLSIVHGVGGYLFDYKAGLPGLVSGDPWGWLWVIGLVLFGGLMVFAAAAEYRGYQRRWCREFAASMLAINWLGVGFYSKLDGADTLTLLAPAFFCACIWTWIAEARVARELALLDKKKE